jgi:hypothetical protein
MKLRNLLTLTTALLAMLSHPATGQTSSVPGFISYQGSVLDASGARVGAGTPVNRTVIFRIWDNPSASTEAHLLYSEAQTVTISEGDFSVLVGQGIANTLEPFGYSEVAKKLADLGNAFNGSGRFLGVTVASNATIAITDNEINPRQQIVSTAFAMRAKFAESISSSSDLRFNPPNGTASNYGLGWYGTGRLFGLTAVDGPVLYGNAGGALGSNVSGTQQTALRWDASGRVGIGATSINSTSNKLTLQGDGTTPADQLTIRGNADNNKRLNIGYDTTNNKATLQSYTAADTTSPLLLNPSGGNVGIGTATPTGRLHVVDTNVDVYTSTGTGTAGEFAKDGLTVDSKPGAGFSSMVVNSQHGSFTDRGIFNVTRAGESQFYVRTDGNVGIGTSAPSSKLSVYSPDSSTETANFRRGTGITSYLHNGSNGDIYWRSSSSAGKVILQDTGGNVAIGTSDATKGRLSVVNGPGRDGIRGSFINFGHAGDVVTHGTHTISIYANQSIWSEHTVIASSDERIKDIGGKSDGSKDLQTLLGIDITDYRYKDKVIQVDTPQKKVIAQQLETVFPQAVSRQTNVIPDIYEKATILEDGWIVSATDLKKGERVRLITTEDDEILEVLEVEKKRFRTEFTPKEGEESLFVYGREVNDFRTVDYDAIAMLNVSATQEIKKEKDAEIAALKAVNAALRKQLADQAVQTTLIEEKNKIRDAKDESLEARLIALERRISKGRATETVSLRTAKVAE